MCRSGAMKRCALVSEPGLRVEELQLARAVRIHEHRQHLAPEQARQRVDMHEEVRARGDPSRAVEREPSTRHDHVHVRMMGERRAPRMQHGGDADPRTEALLIGSDGERCLGRCLHQQVVDHALVLVRNVTQLARQRVHDVKVRYRQELRFAIGQPSARRRRLALRTMPVTAGNGKRPLPALIGIGGCLAAPPLPHHRAYGSVPRRFDRVKLGRAHRFGEDRANRNSCCAAPVGPTGALTVARGPWASRPPPPH